MPPFANKHSDPALVHRLDLHLPHDSAGYHITARVAQFSPAAMGWAELHIDDGHDAARLATAFTDSM